MPILHFTPFLDGLDQLDDTLVPSSWNLDQTYTASCLIAQKALRQHYKSALLLFDYQEHIDELQESAELLQNYWRYGLTTYTLLDHYYSRSPLPEDLNTLFKLGSKGEAYLSQQFHYFMKEAMPLMLYWRMVSRLQTNAEKITQQIKKPIEKTAKQNYRTIEIEVSLDGLESNNRLRTASRICAEKLIAELQQENPQAFALIPKPDSPHIPLPLVAYDIKEHEGSYEIQLYDTSPTEWQILKIRQSDNEIEVTVVDQQQKCLEPATIIALPYEAQHPPAPFLKQWWRETALGTWFWDHKRKRRLLEAARKDRT